MSFGFGFGFPKNYVAALFNTPASLFTTGVNGAWYDPSDWNTLFQDAAGTTPVTAVGQPVGLMLDKSKGLVLGPELVTNGDFSNGATGWALVNTTVSSSQLVFSGAVGSTATQSGIFSSGKNYKFTLDVARTVGTIYVLAGGNVVLTRTVSGTVSFIATGVSAGSLQFLSNDFIGSVDNISVREIPGNHAFNPSGNSANFPVLSARYNLLTKTEEIGGSAWPTKNGSFSLNAESGPTGSNTATLITATDADPYVYQSVTLSAAPHVFSVWVRGFGSSVGKSGTLRCGSNASALYQITANWQLFTFAFTASAGTQNAGVEFPEGAAVGDQVYLWGADLRVANDALNQPAYQRVNTATDYDTVGFKPYLSFNGVNQWLQTNSIDFTYGDKMFVSAGVRKLSDGTQVIVENSVNGVGNSSGTFGVLQTPNWLMASYGTSLSSAGVSATAPITNILSGIGNISGDQAILRVNGSQVASSASDQGTGNFGNYPMFVGARAGTNLWFNGRLYQLVVVGKQASSGEIASTEAFVATKTGVTL